MNRLVDLKNKNIPQQMKVVTLSVLSGILLALAFNIPVLWFLGFIALVPLFLNLKNFQSRSSAFFNGFLVGLIYFGATLSFFFASLPLDWLGIESGAAALLGVTAIWLLSSSVLAIGPALWATVMYVLSDSTPPHLFAPTLWVIAEFIQATLFSLFYAGSDSLIGPHWTFGFLGYILAENTLLLSLASLGGVFILSFIVVFINTLFYGALQKKTVGTVEIISVTSVVLLSCLFFFYSPQPTGSKTVAALHTNFPPSFLQGAAEQEAQFEETNGLLRDLSMRNEPLDIILFPENTFYFSRLPEISRQYRIHSLSRGEETLIIDSIRTDTPGKDESKLVFIKPGDDNWQKRTKRLLVPQGEYLSHSFTLLGKLFLGNEWFDRFNDQRGLLVGKEMVLATAGDTRVGALFCSEVLTPTLYREATKMGAELLTNSASHAVFNDSKILTQQIKKYSRVRAVENGRYYVQAGNGLPSFVISNKGKVISETRAEGNDVLITSIPTFSYQTFFTIIGSAGVLIFHVLLLFLLITAHTRISRKNNPQESLKGEWF